MDLAALLRGSSIPKFALPTALPLQPQVLWCAQQGASVSQRGLPRRTTRSCQRHLNVFAIRKGDDMDILLKELEFPLHRLGSTDLIKAEALESIRRNSDCASAYKDLAIVTYLEGNLREAEEYSRNAINHHPTNIFALKVVGEICLDTGRFSEAMDYYNQVMHIVAARKLPSEKEILKDTFVQIADHHFSIGAAALAVQCYQSICNVWPEDEDAQATVSELKNPEVFSFVENSFPTCACPPPRLFYFASRHRNILAFHESGKSNCELFRKLFAAHGLVPDKSHKILDFGCAVARVARHWDLPPESIYGTDYNPFLVKWCKRYLKGQFSTNPLAGKTRYDNDQFDFLYALSVFTHLTESTQQFWISEFARILKPHALLLVTLHGDNFASQLSEREKETYKSGNMLLWDQIREGTNHCAAFHPVQYVREKMFGGTFTILEHVPGDSELSIGQDIFLLRKN
jgi:tetratricopeptide (TPR) repeat protein